MQLRLGESLIKELNEMAKKILAMIGAFIVGGVGIGIASIMPHAAEAGRMLN
jgi:hypothetical protein